MTEHGKTPVTVLGLGAMGTALVEAEDLIRGRDGQVAVGGATGFKDFAGIPRLTIVV